MKRTLFALAIVAVSLATNAASFHPVPECTTLGCCLNQGPGSENCCLPGHYCPIN